MVQLLLRSRLLRRVSVAVACALASTNTAPAQQPDNAPTAEAKKDTPEKPEPKGDEKEKPKDEW